MQRILKCVKRIDEIFAGTCLFVTVAITAVNVFTRYILNFSIPWAQEVSLTTFTWSIMIGMSCAYRYNMHYGMDFLLTALPKEKSRILRILVYLVMFVGCSVMTYFSVIITTQGWYKVTNYFHMPYTYKYISAVIGFGLMAVYSIQYLFMALRHPEKFYKAVQQGGSGLATDFEHIDEELTLEV